MLKLRVQLKCLRLRFTFSFLLLHLRSKKTNGSLAETSGAEMFVPCLPSCQALRAEPRQRAELGRTAAGPGGINTGQEEWWSWFPLLTRLLAWLPLLIFSRCPAWCMEKAQGAMTARLLPGAPVIRHCWHQTLLQTRASSPVFHVRFWVNQITEVKG